MSQMRIFVSHSHADNAWCRAFVDELRSSGADVWYDEYNLGYGSIMETLQQELEARPIFSVVLSPAALRSPFVNLEMNASLVLHAEDRARVLLPVMAETCDVPVFWRTMKYISNGGDVGVQPTEAARRMLGLLAQQPSLPTPLSSGPVVTQRKGERYHAFYGDLINRLHAQGLYIKAEIGQSEKNWIAFPSGVSGAFRYGWAFTKGALFRTEVWIDVGDADQNGTLLRDLMRGRETLEVALGDQLVWEPLEGKQGCRVAMYRAGSILSSDADLEEIKAWAMERLLKVREVFTPRLAALVS